MGEAVAVIECALLATLLAPVPGIPLEFLRTQVPISHGVKTVGYRKPRNAGIQGEIELPTSARAAGGKARFPQTQPARPVHGIAQRFVPEGNGLVRRALCETAKNNCDQKETVTGSHR